MTCSHKACLGWARLRNSCFILGVLLHQAACMNSAGEFSRKLDGKQSPQDPDLGYLSVYFLM